MRLAAGAPIGAPLAFATCKTRAVPHRMADPCAGKKGGHFMQRCGLSIILGFAGLALAFAAPAAAQTRLSIVTFSGATNLPVWIALDKGFFKKEGLEVTHEVTRGSQQVMEGLMSGKYQFGSAALDNTIAYSEGQGDVKIDNYDLVAILGVHSGMSRIISR